MISKQAIYIIEGKNGVCYIGETVNFRRRCRDHKRHLEIAYSLFSINQKPKIKVLEWLPDNTSKKERLIIEKKYIDDFSKSRLVINAFTMDEYHKKLSKRMRNNTNAYRNEFIRLYNITTNEIIEGYGITKMAKRIKGYVGHLREVIDNKNKSCKGWKSL